MVPAVGIEPTLPHRKQILSLSRLPFRHAGGRLQSSSKGRRPVAQDLRLAKRWPMATAAASAASAGRAVLRFRMTMIILPTWVLSAQP